MPSQEELDQQLGLLNTHRKTLAILLRQKAAAPGAYTPLPTEHGIYEARANIRRVKKILRDWDVPVADHPDDEEDDTTAPSQIAVSSSSTTPLSSGVPLTVKPTPQANQNWIRQYNLIWWAGLSIVVLIVALSQWFLPPLFKPMNQPSSPIPTEFQLPTVPQPSFSATSPTQGLVLTQDLTASTSSIESTAVIPTVTGCQSDVYDFVAQIPSELSAADDVQFGDGLVETVQNGYIYVAHTTDVPHFLKLTTTGNIVFDWNIRPGTGDGEFGYAQAIAVGSDGSVYVADGVRNRIQKLDSNNRFRVWVNENSGAGPLNDPRSIAIDNEGNVYIADTLNNRILKFSSDSNLQGIWDKAGNGEGEFNQPWGIGIDIQKNIIYVADTENHRIQKFDTDGRFLGEWGSQGVGDGQFVQPRAVAVDSEGNIYVVDSTNHRIQKFSNTGKCLAKWGREG